MLKCLVFYHNLFQSFVGKRSSSGFAGFVLQSRIATSWFQYVNLKCLFLMPEMQDLIFNCPLFNCTSIFSMSAYCLSAAAWKLHYYQWAMQLFEQYNLSEGACQFALAALEQVDEALVSTDDNSRGDNENESATTVKGRLWANVFKFMLDLNYYYDAYCAIISNPDEESKYICLRRFIIVLYDCGSLKVCFLSNHYVL